MTLRKAADTKRHTGLDLIKQQFILKTYWTNQTNVFCLSGYKNTETQIRLLSSKEHCIKRTLIAITAFQSITQFSRCIFIKCFVFTFTIAVIWVNAFYLSEVNFEVMFLWVNILSCCTHLGVASVQSLQLIYLLNLKLEYNFALTMWKMLTLHHVLFSLSPI